jgi:hypothetical protein
MLTRFGGSSAGYDDRLVLPSSAAPCTADLLENAPVRCSINTTWLTESAGTLTQLLHRCSPAGRVA